MMMMMKLFLFALVLIAKIHENSSFFLTTSAVAGPKISMPFVGRQPVDRLAQPVTDEATTAAQKSLKEFNSACQRAIEEERREHYYPYLASAGRKY
jgi:hypothetical protein